MSKLELAACMVESVVPLLENRSVILLCDRWYPKGKITSLVDDYGNLDLICNVWIDSVIYDLPPAGTGKRGRPRKQGVQLSVTEDFAFSSEKYSDFYIGTHNVLTNLFWERVVNAYVMTLEIGRGESYRLFLSTIDAEDIHIDTTRQEEKQLHDMTEKMQPCLPLFLYQFR